VPKTGLKAFIENYQAKEDSIPKEYLYKAENYSFRQLEFSIIWEYCASLRTVGDISDVGRGIEYKGDLNIDSKISSHKKPGFQKGFYSYENDPPIDMLPELVWLNISRESIQSSGSGISNKPKVLVNRIRGGRSPWRLRAWMDTNGYPFGKAFISVTPKVDISLFAIWALANSPLANAYLYDYCERDNKEGVIRKGVDFEFKGYYPEGFESAVPLHEYLSEEYHRSTITFADEWVKKHRSPEINEVLRTATEAFEEK
jgi:hypothetical protein